MPDGVSLETLARAKGLPADALRAFGVDDRRNGGVRIEYIAPDGTLARARLRMALGGLAGSRWEEGELPITAYWRPLASELARRRGVLLVCEGESSCWTAWHSGFGAVGIPGADQVAALGRNHLVAAPAVVVVLEPDDPQTYPRGRAHFLAEVTQRLDAIHYSGSVTILDLDGVTEDINALYQTAPSTFERRLEQLIERGSRRRSSDAGTVATARPANDVRVADDDLERVVALSRRYLGCVAPDVPPGVDVANWVSISRFVESTGDENPLYTDVRYGARSIHSTMLAPPAFVLAVRMPDSAGALDAAPHRLVDVLTSLQLIWDDNIKLGDQLRGRVRLTDVTATSDGRSVPSVRVFSGATYERNGVAFAQGESQVDLYSLSGDVKPFAERSIHRYDAAEIAAIERQLEAEPTPRGDVPRFWSATQIGELLPVLHKGPLTFSDMLVWRVAESRPVPASNLHHHVLGRLPGRRATNPLTGWPAWDRAEAWDDSAAASVAGLPAPAARGGLLFALAGQLVTHWMGDDAFLRRLGVRISQPLFYGDLLELGGVVVDRFVAMDEASHGYHAVIVEVTGRNQLRQLVLEGDAVVLLPEPGKPVVLPICGGLSCDPPGGG